MLHYKSLSVYNHTKTFRDFSVALQKSFSIYEGGSICNENPIITSSTNALRFYSICQTKDQSVAIMMVHETLFCVSKFNKLQTF